MFTPLHPKGIVLEPGIDENPTALLEAARNNTSSFWTKRGVVEARIERYAAHRDIVSHTDAPDFQEQFIVTEVDPDDQHAIHPFNQGSPLMLLRGAVQERKRLRYDENIVDILQRLWKALPKDDFGKVDKFIYSRLHRKIIQWLMPDISETQADEILEGDWRQDSRGAPNLDEETFCDVLYTAADIWVPGLNPLDYVKFFTKCRKFALEKGFAKGYDEYKKKLHEDAKRQPSISQEPKVVISKGQTNKEHTTKPKPRINTQKATTSANTHQTTVDLNFPSSPLVTVPDLEKNSKRPAKTGSRDNVNGAGRTSLNSPTSKTAKDRSDLEDIRQDFSQLLRPDTTTASADQDSRASQSAVSNLDTDENDSDSQFGGRRRKKGGKNSSGNSASGDSNAESATESERERRRKKLAAERARAGKSAAELDDELAGKITGNGADLQTGTSAGGQSGAATNADGAFALEVTAPADVHLVVADHFASQDAMEDQAHLLEQQQYAEYYAAMWNNLLPKPSLAAGVPWTIDDLAKLREPYVAKTDKGLEVSAHASNVLGNLQPSGLSQYNQSSPTQQYRLAMAARQGQGNAFSRAQVSGFDTQQYDAEVAARNIDARRLMKVRRDVMRKKGLPEVKQPRVSVVPASRGNSPPRQSPTRAADEGASRRSPESHPGTRQSPTRAADEGASRRSPESHPGTRQSPVRVVDEEVLRRSPASHPGRSPEGLRSSSPPPQRVAPPSPVPRRITPSPEPPQYFSVPTAPTLKPPSQIEMKRGPETQSEALSFPKVQNRLLAHEPSNSRPLLSRGSASPAPWTAESQIGADGNPRRPGRPPLGTSASGGGGGGATKGSRAEGGGNLRRGNPLSPNNTAARVNGSSGGAAGATFQRSESPIGTRTPNWQTQAGSSPGSGSNIVGNLQGMVPIWGNGSSEEQLNVSTQQSQNTTSYMGGFAASNGSAQDSGGHGRMTGAGAANVSGHCQEYHADFNGHGWPPVMKIAAGTEGPLPSSTVSPHTGGFANPHPKLPDQPSPATSPTYNISNSKGAGRPGFGSLKAPHHLMAIAAKTHGAGERHPAPIPEEDPAGVVGFRRSSWLLGAVFLPADPGSPGLAVPSPVEDRAGLLAPLDWLRTSGSVPGSPVRHDKELSYGVDLSRTQHTIFPLLASTPLRVVVSELDQAGLNQSTSQAIDSETLQKSGLQPYLTGKLDASYYTVQVTPKVKYIPGKSVLLRTVATDAISKVEAQTLVPSFATSPP